jgi:hypothetical protein
VFENRVLRIHKPKREYVTGEGRRLHNGKLNDVCTSPCIIWVSRRMKWAGHAARMRNVHAGYWWGNMRERDHLEETPLDERIIIKWVFGKWDEVMD